MPKRIIVNSIIIARGVVTTKNSRGGEIHRPKERFELKPGESFDFTDAELEDIMATTPESVTTKAEVDIDDLPEDVEVKGGKATKTPAAKTAAAKKGGKDDL